MSCKSHPGTCWWWWWWWCPYNTIPGVVLLPSTPILLDFFIDKVSDCHQTCPAIQQSNILKGEKLHNSTYEIFTIQWIFLLEIRNIIFCLWRSDVLVTRGFSLVQSLVPRSVLLKLAERCNNSISAGWLTDWSLALLGFKHRNTRSELLSGDPRSMLGCWRGFSTLQN